MPYAQFTLAQMQTLFYEQVGGNTAFFRPTEVTFILQEAFRVFNCMTGFWRNSFNMGGTIANVNYYATPQQLTYPLRVLINGQSLQSTSLSDLDYGRPEWENEACTYGTVPQAFAAVGINYFAIWPASFGGGESMVVEGVVPAPNLFLYGPNDQINLGQDELECILDYAEHIAQFKEGGQEFEASQDLLKEFLKQAGNRNAVLMQSSKFRGWMGLSAEKTRPMRISNERVGAR